MEEVKTYAKGLVEEGLFAAAEESGAAGFRGADIARRRNTAAVDKSFRGRGEIEKRLLAEF